MSALSSAYPARCSHALGSTRNIGIHPLSILPHCDISQEDFFYSVIETTNKEVDRAAFDSRSRSSSEATVIHHLTPNSPDPEEEEEPLGQLTSHYLPLPQVPFVTVDTPSTASSLTPSTLSCDESPERQNLFVPASFIPSSILSPQKRLSTLPPSVPDPAIHTTSSSTASFTTALPPVVQPAQPTQPVQPTIMSSAPFKMPLRGTNAAPKFNGTPTRLIPFFEDVELLADYAGLTAEQHIKAAIRYTPIDESEMSSVKGPTRLYIQTAAQGDKESEDTMDDKDVAVEADEDIAMSHVANTEQQTDVTAVMPSETIDWPAAMASVKDFPAEHWQEVTNETPILPPPPPPPPAPAATPTTSLAKPTIHDCVVSLAARVAAMEMADHNTLARVDAMEHDFDSYISSMRRKCSIRPKRTAIEATPY
ncbi:hypothetical protein DFJ58DRAFT_730197 [Suillus subalutaceus]|uniref:uncharacterized protein n=1 Tax=Suillus subalutaceus TaxID=48586 RepID=UPI001B86B59C|nr:uncharacterized protein DFJ58DRAFT_730197 [Suillus subalutaceus]KAG1847315.1 hypothetical protein DFJ58DRAFT_730197 [Suillus subalutaceus]